MRSSKIQILIVALVALFLSTGAGGGCGGGGSSEPTIDGPTTESSCPAEMPEPWSTCDLEDGERCQYEKITCCTADGGEGDVNYATTAQCADGQWAIMMAMIMCENGYWPNNCSN